MKPLKLMGSVLRPPQAYRFICCMLTWALICLGCQLSVSDQPFLDHTVGRHVCHPCVTTERVMGCLVVAILTCSMGQ